MSGGAASGDAAGGGWSWDDSLFAGAARYYEQGRLPYAAGLADAFADSLGADGTGRLLDVGCGPGSIALRLAAGYRQVVGVDPDEGMIAEAQRLASLRDVVNATFVLGRAEELPLGLGRFDTITFAASFHWMQRERVAAIAREMLAAGGTVVHVDTDRTDPDTTYDRYPPPPGALIDRLVRNYLGDARRAGRFVGFVSPGNEDEIWRRAGFTGPNVVRVAAGEVLDRTINDVVAATLSMSSSAPHLFGSRLAAFEADLRALLGAASTDGLFNVHVPDTILKVWRPSSSMALPGSGSDRPDRVQL